MHKIVKFVLMRPQGYKYLWGEGGWLGAGGEMDLHRAGPSGVQRICGKERRGYPC